jgi:hypothetical protein
MWKMKDLMLSASVKAQMFAADAVSRARRVMKGEGAERADVVQTVIIIGIFVVICVIVGGLIMSAMRSQGTSLSSCIANVNKTSGCSNFSK